MGVRLKLTISETRIATVAVTPNEYRNRPEIDDIAGRDLQAELAQEAVVSREEFGIVGEEAPDGRRLQRGFRDAAL